MFTQRKKRQSCMIVSLYFTGALELMRLLRILILILAAGGDCLQMRSVNKVILQSHLQSNL